MITGPQCVGTNTHCCCDIYNIFKNCSHVSPHTNPQMSPEGLCTLSRAWSTFKHVQNTNHWSLANMRKVNFEWIQESSKTEVLHVRGVCICIHLGAFKRKLMLPCQPREVDYTELRLLIIDFSTKTTYKKVYVNICISLSHTLHLLSGHLLQTNPILWEPHSKNTFKSHFKEDNYIWCDVSLRQRWVE